MPIAKLHRQMLCLLLACLAVFHLTAQGFSPGAVLCLQADGQVTVEIPGAGQGCAGPAPTEHHRPLAATPMALLVSEEDCGPCADLLLPDESPAERPAARHFATSQLPVSIWQHLAPLSLDPVRFAGAALNRPPSGVLPPIQLRQSTVLLI